MPWGSVWIIDSSTRGEEKIVQKIEAHDKIDSGHQRGRDGGIRGPHHHNCRYVQASIYTGISGELASIAEFNGGEIQSGFDTVERAALGIQDYIGRLYSGQVTEEGDADLQQSTLYPGRALTSAAYNLEQFVVETARNTVKNTPEIKMLGVMFEPYQLQSDMEEYGFYVTMDTADTSIHIYDAYEGYAKEDSYRIPAGEGHPYISQPYQDGDGMVVAYGTPITYGGRVVGVVITSVDLGAFSSVKSHKYEL